MVAVVHGDCVVKPGPHTDSPAAEVAGASGQEDVRVLASGFIKRKGRGLRDDRTQLDAVNTFAR